MADRKADEAGKVLMGRQYIRMILDFFKTQRTLQEQYTYEDLQAIKFKGDDHLKEFFDSWKLIMGSLGEEWQDPGKQETLISTFLPETGYLEGSGFGLEGVRPIRGRRREAHTPLVGAVC